MHARAGSGVDVMPNCTAGVRGAGAVGQAAPAHSPPAPHTHCTPRTRVELHCGAKQHAVADAHRAAIQEDACRGVRARLQAERQAGARRTAGSRQALTGSNFLRSKSSRHSQRTLTVEIAVEALAQMDVVAAMQMREGRGEQ